MEAAALVGRILWAIEGPDEVKGALVDEVYRHSRLFVVLAIWSNPELGQTLLLHVDLKSANAPAISLFTLRSRASISPPAWRR